MLYDCFIFFNELELLDIRLNTLNDIIDKFVIVEATRTFTGKPKELFFKKNKNKFAKFLDKIVYIIVNDFPDSENPWNFEKHQRNAIGRGLSNCQPDDIILISDIDEIPRPEVVLNVKDLPGVKALRQNLYYYYLNVKSQGDWLHGTRIVFYKDFTNAQDIRMNNGKLFANGGWHFSYLGGAEQIKLKIRSFSHQEFNTEKIFKNIDKAIRKN